ncbi:MAG: PQQ-dependent dehydrogenase, methanol/ethanol family, partial [Porticoccaceae bacterium]|nr:PQQ-dependent dehydrogenase, methanol/ethanol family [Porticoccaceae bacterium]
FMAIVLGGSKSEHGMLGYHETLTAPDVENIHKFLNKKQQELPDKLEMSYLQKLEYWGIFWMSKLGEKFPIILNWTRDLIM